MLKMLHLVPLISLVIAVSNYHTLAQTGGGRDGEDIKQEVHRLYAGTGEEIAVHMKSGATVIGRVTEMETEFFTVRQAKIGPGQEVFIRYADVSKVEKVGPAKRSGLSNGQKTALIIAAAG